MIIQLEYINHLLQFIKNISYYAGIMLNAFSDLAGIYNWLAPNCKVIVTVYVDGLVYTVNIPLQCRQFHLY